MFILARRSLLSGAYTFQEFKAVEQTSSKTFEYRVSGGDLLGTIKKLIHEGNVRRITIKNEEGKTLIEVPLTLGVIGTVLMPVWAAIGAIAALVNHCTIAVETGDVAEGTSQEEKRTVTIPID
jgi:hypothetical protein